MPTATPPKAIGKIFPKDSIPLRIHAGTATNGSFKYDLSTSLGGAPIIRSNATGKYFAVSWRELLELADAAGIDQPD